ncbi:uncharacterized protein M421DRAFT_207615 [Didymella exigua CBS 183.55]|uniref:Uncharacterized protein n=1 Tax=Didymella exigua CBS 183.55 TaxID=1150837 RepID=A0A6A5RGE7_9PLEO|nr:uncharacterized protein M421DRAFT_207615 [Didymella exigua CBS 183.55]KAF1926822.1 hypothetical protein M421DRAFT_207615 [Didymella exigua CBS 183.55]
MRFQGACSLRLITPDSGLMSSQSVGNGHNLRSWAFIGNTVSSSELMVIVNAGHAIEVSLSACRLGEMNTRSANDRRSSPLRNGELKPRWRDESSNRRTALAAHQTWGALQRSRMLFAARSSSVEIPTATDARYLCELAITVQRSEHSNFQMPCLHAGMASDVGSKRVGTDLLPVQFDL